MVAYSNRILDIADECDLNDITQQEIMAMFFITHCRSPQFRQELRRHGVGVTWQFIRKEAQGWDRSKRCEEQSNDKAYAVKRNTQKAQNRSQAKNQRPNNASPKKELADAFFQGKCRRCGSTVHSVKDCKVSAEVVCRNCSKTGHLSPPNNKDVDEWWRISSSKGRAQTKMHKKLLHWPCPDASATRPQYTDADYLSQACAPSGKSARQTPAARSPSSTST